MLSDKKSGDPAPSGPLDSKEEIALLRKASDHLDRGEPARATDILKRLSLATDNPARSISDRLTLLRKAGRGASGHSTTNSPEADPFRQLASGISRTSHTELRQPYLDGLSERAPALYRSFIEALHECRSQEGVLADCHDWGIGTEAVETSEKGTYAGALLVGEFGQPCVFELHILKASALSRSRDVVVMHGGKVFDPHFNVSLHVRSPYADELYGAFGFTPQIASRSLEVPPRGNAEITNLINTRLITGLKDEWSKSFSDRPMTAEGLFPNLDSMLSIFRRNQLLDLRKLSDSTLTLARMDDLCQEWGRELSLAYSAVPEVWSGVLEKFDALGLLKELASSGQLSQIVQAAQRGQAFGGFLYYRSSPLAWPAGFRGRGR